MTLLSLPNVYAGGWVPTIVKKIYGSGSQIYQECFGLVVGFNPAHCIEGTQILITKAISPS